MLCACVYAGVLAGERAWKCQRLAVSVFNGDARGQQSLSSMALWLTFGTESLAAPGAGSLS